MSGILPAPLGFPECPDCYYLQHGSPKICTECAYHTIQPLPGPLCSVCAQQIKGERCINSLCMDSDRSIDRIEAIASYQEPLRNKIIRLKNSDTKYGWAIIFGRLVVGYLDSTMADYTVIVANPTYKPDGGYGHTELVLWYASNEDVHGRWNFAPKGLYLPRPKKSRGHTLSEKKAAAEELAEILVISTGLSLDGGRVLVYDDVCTSGYQLDAIARRLKGEGAVSVTGLVLARTPWG